MYVIFCQRIGESLLLSWPFKPLHWTRRAGEHPSEETHISSQVRGSTKRGQGRAGQGSSPDARQILYDPWHDFALFEPGSEDFDLQFKQMQVVSPSISPILSPNSQLSPAVVQLDLLKETPKKCSETDTPRASSCANVSPPPRLPLGLFQALLRRGIIGGPCPARNFSPRTHVGCTSEELPRRVSAFSLQLGGYRIQHPGYPWSPQDFGGSKESFLPTYIPPISFSQPGSWLKSSGCLFLGSHVGKPWELAVWGSFWEAGADRHPNSRQACSFHKRLLSSWWDHFCRLVCVLPAPPPPMWDFSMALFGLVPSTSLL